MKRKLQSESHRICACIFIAMAYSFSLAAAAAKDPSPASSAGSRPTPETSKLSGVKVDAHLPTVAFIELLEFDGRRDLNETWVVPRGETREWDHHGRIFVDSESLIKIKFDRLTLASDSHFSHGRLSLAAELNGRAIEVEGYSEVGKDQSPVKAPPLGTARFLYTIRAIQRQIAIVRASGSNEELSDQDYARSAAMLAALLDNLKVSLSSEDAADVFADVMKTDPEQIVQYQIDLAKALRKLELVADYGESPHRQQEGVMKHIEETRAAINSKQKERANYDAALSKIKSALQSQPIDQPSMKSSGSAPAPDANPTATEATQPVSSAIDQTKELSNNIKRVDDEISDQNAKLARLEQDHQEILATPVRSRAARSAVARVISDLSALNAELGLPKAATIEEVEAALSKAWGNATEPSEKAKKLQLGATSSLVDGQILLKKQDAKNGDILRIYLLHYQTSSPAVNVKEPSGIRVDEKPVKYSIAEIYVKNFGFRREVVDSFLLVKQLHESDTNTSNFKGAPGFSLLWSYGFRPGESKALWHALDLSWGVNVSYVDFDPKKEIEIGVAGVLGLFHNQIHGGCGLNLNVVGSDRPYCFVGFSFAKIYEHVTHPTTP